jgi:uncharacterized SAM-binding protein YcdF (DUF218 family)
MNKNFFKGCLGINVIILSGILIVFMILVGVGSFLSVGDPVKPVDAIVVLSGDEGVRIKEASDWYLRGYGKYLLITKTDDKKKEEKKTYSEKLMRIAIELGVPQDSILFSEGMASNTIEEAKAVLLVAKTRNINSILVVTDPYHTRRADIIFDLEFKDQEIDTYVHGVRNSWYQPYSWFFRVSGWRVTISELAGLFFLMNQRN